MSLNGVLWKERVAIVRKICLSIHSGVKDTWMRSNTPQEPDFVAGLVLVSSPLIHKALSTILFPYSVQIATCAVYCHQSPKVKFSRGSPCELGDLLFVHVHTSANGDVERRNALLYQAKVASAPHRRRLDKKELHQLRLYTEWPDFLYQLPQRLSGQWRFVTPKLPHTGAQYMLIDKRPLGHQGARLPATCPIGSCMPDQFLQYHNHLARELFEVLILRSGRPFADRAHGSRCNGWSQVVWDLLDVGFTRTFRRAVYGENLRWGGDASVYDGCYFGQTTSSMAYTTVADIIGKSSADRLMSSPPSDERPKHDGKPEPESGVSVILVETQDEAKSPQGG